MAGEIRNRFGRRGGRGIRPWLLLPKIVAVAVYLGGLASVLGIWSSSGINGLVKEDPKRVWLIDLVAWLMERMVVPALLGAIVFGVLLFLQHPRTFVRMRWLIVKLISLAILIPSAHWFCSSRLAMVRQSFPCSVNDTASTQLTWGVAGALAGSVWVAVLGRLKPRMGQQIRNSKLEIRDKSDGGKSE